MFLIISLYTRRALLVTYIPDVDTLKSFKATPICRQNYWGIIGVDFETIGQLMNRSSV
jgi:hypothetical protein